MADNQTNDALPKLLLPLTQMDPAGCVALPPRRLPMPDGEEFLVEWRRGPTADQWLLRITKRPVSVDDTEGWIQKFEAVIRLADPSTSSTVTWENRDASFAEWVEENLKELVASVAARQSDERRRITSRASITHARTTVKDFIPHAVILACLAAFIYMFAAVHIKP